MSGVWIPGMPAASQEEFVHRLHRKIDEFVSRRGHEQAVVELELADGTRYTLHSISAEPGFGFITLVPYPEDEARPWPRSGDGEVPPDEVIVSVATIRRITLNDAAESTRPLGFSLPAAQ